tara:strand:+ start:182 stop:781 length:600 start_codon:yes stop_codon:yes gene_type:complete
MEENPQEEAEYFKPPGHADLVMEKQLQLVDEYFSNGYNGRAAYMSIYPNCSSNRASSSFSAIMRKPDIKEYVIEKRRQLRSRVNIEPEQIIEELINWVYSDPTEFMALTPDDVKALPKEVKRCIQSVNYKKNTTYDSKGNKRENEVMDLKFVDKTKAVEMLNKMLGFYAIDNKQKSNNINVENLNVAELKVLQQILTKE